MRLLRIIALLAITGCGAPQAFVNVDNAPVARGNLNSVGAAVGTMYLYDMTERSMTRIADTVQQTAVVNSGSFTQTASSDIMIEISNVPVSAQPSVTAAVKAGVANSLAFTMSKYEQRSIPSPGNALNAPNSLDFFASERPRANDENFRYVFVVDGYQGEDISITWDGRPTDGNTFNLTTGAPSLPEVKVTIRRSALIQCQGMANTCVFNAQVYRLRALEDGSLRFELDTSLSRPGRIQRMLNGQPLPPPAA
jgi:hypothetical protein